MVNLLLSNFMQLFIIIFSGNAFDIILVLTNSNTFIYLFFNQNIKINKIKINQTKKSNKNK